MIDGVYKGHKGIRPYDLHSNLLGLEPGSTPYIAEIETVILQPRNLPQLNDCVCP